jgi:DNA-binding Lrp family transcriptional regulator
MWYPEQGSHLVRSVFKGTLLDQGEYHLHVGMFSLFFVDMLPLLEYSSSMDDIDRKILAELQMNARLTLTELAERVGISLSPCHRRVHVLEEAGIIQQYRTLLDRDKLGLTFPVIVFVTLRDGDRAAVQAFEKAVTSIPEIVSAQRLFGDPDYILHVLTQDLPTFQRLYDEQLSSLEGVQRLTSTLVMKNLFQDRPLFV